MSNYQWPNKGYGREGAINPHKEQLRRFQERRALQVELKQTVGVNVPIEERGKGPEGDPTERHHRQAQLVSEKESNEEGAVGAG